MPIHIDFFHPGRLAVIVARGTITGEDITEAIRQMLASGAMHYRKLIDVSSTSSPMSAEDVEKTAIMLRSQPNAASRGPVAFVFNPGRVAINAQRFTQLTEGERPIKVFYSLHEARKWLEEQPLGSP